MRSPSILGVLACLTAALVGGCNQRPGGGSSESASGAVAVIDLDRIAERLGSDKQMAAAITQRQSSWQQQLAELAAAYKSQLAERQKTAEQAAAQDGAATLTNLQREANAKFSQAKQQAAQDLNAHRAQLVTQFRERIRPVARRAANQRGLSVIVTKNDAVVFDYSTGVDITEDVIAALQTAPTAAPTAAMPRTAAATTPTVR